MATPNAELRKLLKQVGETEGFTVAYRGHRAFVYGPDDRQAVFKVGSTGGVDFHAVELLLRHVGWVNTPTKKAAPARRISTPTLPIPVAVEPLAHEPVVEPEPALTVGVDESRKDTHMGSPIPHTDVDAWGAEVIAYLKDHAPQAFTADEVATAVPSNVVTAASRAAGMSYYFLEAHPGHHPEWLHIHRNERVRPFLYEWRPEARDPDERKRRSVSGRTAKARANRSRQRAEALPPPKAFTREERPDEALFEHLVDLPDGVVLLRRDDGAIFEAKLLRQGVAR